MTAFRAGGPKGRPTRMAATAALLAASFSTTAFAQRDVAPANVRTYSEHGDWIVEFVPAERQRQVPAFCQATRVYDQGVQLRIVSGANLYAIDFQGQNYLADNAKRFELEYGFDAPNSPPRRANANLITDGEGFDWIRILEPASEPGSADDMMNSRQLTLRTTSGRNNRWQYQVNGSNRALNSLFDCRDERVLGQPRRRAPAPVAQGQPQFVPTPQVQQSPPPPPPVAQLPRAPQRDNFDFCNDYATQMVTNTERALQAKCAGWPAGHRNHLVHFDWCRTKPSGDVDKALASWSGRLQGCLASQGGGVKPQPVTYHARWDWKGALKSKRDPNNTSSFKLTSSTGGFYCYKQDCRNVTVAKGPDGSLSFSTNGKNYFELNPRSNQFNARFWEDFAPPARAPDATAVFVRK
ncbi:MAG: hypothetical protein AB7V13_04800 [Pseudorhodoplanes sp.]